MDGVTSYVSHDVSTSTLVLWTVLHFKMPVINVLFTIMGLNHNRFNTQFQSHFQWMLIEIDIK